MASGGRDLAVRYVRWLAVTAVALAGFWSCALAVDPAQRQHLTGQSRPLTIDIVGTTRGDECVGSRAETYAVTYRVVGETDERSAEACRKERPATGRTEVWLTDDGELQFDSPRERLAWAVAMPFLVAGAVTFLGARRRRDDD